MIHMGSGHRSVKMMKRTRPDDANKFEELCAELDRKIKHEAEIAAATQKLKMTESLKQAEGVIDAEVAASPLWNEDANAAAAEFGHADERLVVGDAAARHSNEDTNAAVAETDQAESRLVAEATSTRNRGVDTNGAAATAKEKAERTKVMSRSQEI